VFWSSKHPKCAFVLRPFQRLPWLAPNITNVTGQGIYAGMAGPRTKRVAMTWAAR